MDRPATIDGLEALRRADDGFYRLLRRIGTGDWHRPTPCAQWDVRQVVNHVVVGGGRYGRLVRGGSRAAFALAAWSETGLPRHAGGVRFFDGPTTGASASDLECLLRLAGREP